MSDEDDAPEEFLQLGRQLTADSSGILGTAGLALADDVPDVETAVYQPDVLRKWADELENIDGQVRVGVSPCRKYDRSGPEDDPSYANALFAHVPESGVVAFAAPWTGDLQYVGDEEGSE